MAKKIKIDVIDLNDNYENKSAKSLNSKMNRLNNKEISGFYIRQGKGLFEIQLDKNNQPFECQ